MSWNVTGLAVPGLSHILDGRDGEDAIAAAVWHTALGETMALGASDGVGSTPRAGAAARLAVEAAIGHLRSLELTDTHPAVLTQTMCAAVTAAQSAIDTMNRAPRQQPACTLLLALVVAGRLVTAAVGDGAIAHIRSGGEVLLVQGPNSGSAENASVTRALSVGAPVPAPDVFVIDDESLLGVALCSDGLANVSVVSTPEGPTVAPNGALCVLANHVAGGGEIAEIYEYLVSDVALRALSGDDISLAIGWRT